MCVWMRLSAKVSKSTKDQTKQDHTWRSKRWARDSRQTQSKQGHKCTCFFRGVPHRKPMTNHYSPEYIWLEKQCYPLPIPFQLSALLLLFLNPSLSSIFLFQDPPSRSVHHDVSTSFAPHCHPPVFSPLSFSLLNIIILFLCDFFLRDPHILSSLQLFRHPSLCPTSRDHTPGDKYR